MTYVIRFAFRMLVTLVLLMMVLLTVTLFTTTVRLMLVTYVGLAAYTGR